MQFQIPIATPWRRAHVEMDFLCFLPPEVVLKIFSYIGVREALKCLEVSRSWYKTISSFRSYWQHACEHWMGLVVNTHHHASLPGLAAAGLRHRKWITTCGSQIGTFYDSLISRPATCDKRGLSAIGRLSGVQENGSTGCFLGHALVLSSPCEAPRVRHLCTVSLKVINYAPLNRSASNFSLLDGLVVWAKAAKDCLLLLLSNGEWVCFSHTTNEVLVRWKSGLSVGVLTQSAHRLSPSLINLKAYSVTHITCCEKCFMVVLVKANHSCSRTWDLQIIKVGKTGATPEVATSRTVLVQLLPEESLLQWLLLSKSHDQDELGFCKRHSLLYQTSTLISVCRVNLHESEARMITETNRVALPTSNNHKIDPETNLPSVVSVCLSADQQLLASLVDPYHLYVCMGDTELGAGVCSQVAVGERRSHPKCKGLPHCSWPSVHCH